MPLPSVNEKKISEAKDYLEAFNASINSARGGMFEMLKGISKATEAMLEVVENLDKRVTEGVPEFEQTE